MSQSVLDIPEELKMLVPALRDAVDTAMTQVERAKLGGSVNYAEFENEIREKVCEIERRVHEAALAALDPNVPKLMINKVLHARVLENEPTTFMTLPGPVSVMRSLYRPVGKRNAPTVDVVALRAGVIRSVWLPATAREMAFDMQQLTSREAETTGKRRGRLPYSRSSFEDVGHAVGEMHVQQHHVIEHVLIEDFDVPDDAQSVTVSLDRVSVPMEEPLDEEDRFKARENGEDRVIKRAYRMAYCATVTLHDANGKALYTIRYGTMPGGDPVGLCEGLADDVVAVLAKRPDLALPRFDGRFALRWRTRNVELARRTVHKGPVQQEGHHHPAPHRLLARHREARPGRQAHRW